MKRQSRLGRLIVMSGPSGVGKGTLIDKLIPILDNAFYSISMTTRSPRQGEKEANEYFFTNRQDFEKRIKADEFLEWADVYGNLYGTPQESVDKKMHEGFDVILEVDVQGALQVKKKRSEAIYVFILPPSLEELFKRIKKRNLDDLPNINKRMAKAESEIALADNFDYQVLNSDPDQAADELYKLIVSEVQQWI